MQAEEPNNSVREDLIARLRNLVEPQSSGTLAELAYRRAREALERALEEARTIRLYARIEDARTAQERDQASLQGSLRSLQQATEAKIEALSRTAEIEAERLRHEARREAASFTKRRARRRLRPRRRPPRSGPTLPREQRRSSGSRPSSTPSWPR